MLSFVSPRAFMSQLQSRWEATFELIGNLWVDLASVLDVVVVMHPLSGLWRGIRRDDSLEVSLRE